MSFPKACGLLILLLISALLQAQEAKTLLWRITGNGLARPSYLYGTIHVKEKRVFNFGDSLYAAIQRTEGLAIEVDPEEITAFYTAFSDMEDTTGLIRTQLKPEDFQFVAPVIREKFKLNPDSVSLFQFYWLQRRLRDDHLTTKDEMPEFMDLWLLAYARSLKKWTGGIEDAGDQRSVQQLINSAKDIGVFRVKKEETGEMLNKLTGLYLACDLRAIDTFWGRREHELLRRNRKMARRIDSLARIRTTCCLVGAAHLPGEKGVISYLRQRGFSVEPVMSSRYFPAEQVMKMLPAPQWRLFADPDSLYTVSMPGMPRPVENNSRQQQVYFYQDRMGSAAYSSGWSLNSAGIDAPELFADMLEKKQREKQKKPVMERRPIAHNGLAGLELLYRDVNDIWIRGQIFLSGKYFFFISTGNLAKEKVLTPSADSFFKSFRVNTARTGKTQEELWRRHTDSLLGFSLETPVELQEMDKNDSLLQTFSGVFAIKDCRYFTGLDSASGNYIIVRVEKAMPGQYFVPLGIEEANQAEAFEKAYDVKLKSQNISRDNIPGWRVRGATSNGEGEIMGMGLLRSTHNYYVFTFSGARWPKVLQAAERVLNSFRLTPLKPMPLRTHFFEGYQALLPTAPVPDPPDSNSLEMRYWTTYDSLACSSYQLMVKPLPPFYSAKNDTAFLRDHYYDKFFDNPAHTLRPVQNGKLKGWEIDRPLDDSGYNRLISRVLINGDSVIQLFSSYSPQSGVLPSIRRFMESFRVVNEEKDNDIFQSKNRELLEALGSFTESRYAAALEALEQAVPRKEDLPKAHQLLLRRYMVNTEGAAGTYQLLADWIARLADPSSVEFVRQEFPRLGAGQEEQGAAMVSLLGKIKTRGSYALLRQILLQRPPDSSLMTRYYQFNWNDSLELIAGFFPEILRLSADSSMAEKIAEWYLDLKEKNLARPDWLTPAIEAHYLREGGRLALQFKTREVVASLGWAYEARIRMLAELNAPAATALLQQLTASPTQIIKLVALKGLLKKKAEPSKAALQTLAADRLYRYRLYEALHKAARLEWMPKPYLEKAGLAESLLYNSLALDDIEPDSLILLKAVDLKTAKGQFRYFLFRIVYDDGGGAKPYLGIAGKFLIQAGKHDPDMGGNDLWIRPCEDFSAEAIGQILRETVFEAEGNLKE